MAITKISTDGIDGNLGSKISTQTVSSSVSTLDFDNVFSSTYDNYIIRGTLECDTSALVYLNMRVGTGSTPTYVTSSTYFYGNFYESTHSDDSDNTGANGEHNDSKFNIGATDLRSSKCHFTINAHNINDASNNKQTFLWQYFHNDEYENRVEGNFGHGSVTNANAFTSFRLYFSSNNILSGKVSVYGVNQ